MSINQWVGMGRLTADPEIRYTKEEQKPVARYTVAISRDRDEADFVRCTAFDRHAEFAEKYMHKGGKYCIAGRIHTGNYIDKETGKRVYTTEIYVTNQDFASGSRPAEPASEEFVPISGEEEDQPPFR